MSTPDTTRGGQILGQPQTRIDGPKKVQGQAPYAADQAARQDMDPRPYHGWIVEATIGKGRITRIDTDRAKAQAGVVEVITHDNAPKQKPWGQPDDADRFTMSHALLADDEVHYHGQAIALVVAETLEAARGAALLVDVEYEEDESARYQVTGEESGDDLIEPDELDGGQDPDVCEGDFDAAMDAADVTVDQIYTTPGQIAAAMEPHATIAHWDGESLTIHTSIQVVSWGVTALANTFGLDEAKIHLRSPYIGGGFGSKLSVHGDAVLATIGAMVVEHPVRVVQTRRNLFANGPHRGNARQRVRLGAREDGTLTAVGHDNVMPMKPGYPFAEPVAAGARAMYRCDALHTTHRVVLADVPLIDSMRAPGEAIGTLALEIAMDELAVALDMDPVALRVKNIAEREPQSGKPFASNHLRRCLEEGAARFGWSQRPEPRQRKGRWWQGWGMSACTRMNMLMEAEARVTLDGDGRARVELDMTDIGTGSYTIMAQIAADTLGLSIDAVDVHLGDSALPTSSGSGGSFGAASSGGAVFKACQSLLETLASTATVHQDSPLLGASGDPRAEHGRLFVGDGGRSVSLVDAVALMGKEVTAHGKVEPDDDDDHAQYTYGAHFVELAVDGATGEIRLGRMLGAFAFGRVLNPLTARSQLIGGMTFGIGGALTEALALDPRYGAFMNRDLAEYHLPVQRDVPDLEVLLLGEPDDKCGPLASKGVGELGLCGVAAAISSAVYHATGVRLRDMPMTPDKLLADLPPV